MKVRSKTTFNNNLLFKSKVAPKTTTKKILYLDVEHTVGVDVNASLILKIESIETIVK